MDRWATPPKQVTSPTWDPPPPCNQALKSLPTVPYPTLPKKEQSGIKLFTFMYTGR